MGEKSAAQVALAGLVQLASGVIPAAGGFGRVVILESAEHIELAQRLVGTDGLIFCPEADDLPAGVVAYAGALTAPGDELLVADDLFVYAQDYLATPFLAVAGPTVVRVGDERDYEAFLQDADLARDKGVFVEQLLHAGVFLADQCALGTTHPCAGSRRLYVSATGEMRTAPGGQVLGSVDDDVNTAGDACLNAVVDADTVDTARAERPWLSRYLRALDVLRGLRANGRTGFQVSGFGGRFTEGLPTELVEQTDAPILVWNSDEQLLCDPAQDRVLQLGADAARFVELLLIAQGTEHAAELAVAHLGMDRDTARAAIDVVTTKFADIDFRASGVLV